MTIQIARTASAGGQTQLSRSMTAGPGWNTIRPSPIEPRNVAGTAIQVCGWALKRVDRTAMRPQPRPKAKSTDPVTSGSEPPDAGLSSKATARTAPATSEPTMARTGERVLVPRGMRDESERCHEIPPTMRASEVDEG